MEWVEKETEFVLRNVRRNWNGSWVPRVENKLRERIRKALQLKAENGLKVVSQPEDMVV